MVIIFSCRETLSGYYLRLAACSRCHKEFLLEPFQVIKQKFYEDANGVLREQRLRDSNGLRGCLTFEMTSTLSPSMGATGGSGAG